MREQLNLSLLLAFACVASTVLVGNSALYGQTATESETYKIYSLLLDPLGKDTGGKARKELVIQTETESYPSFGGDDRDACLKPNDADESILRPVVQDYFRANEKPSRLQSRFLQRYKLVPSSQIESYFGPNGGDWEAFYKAYPNSGGYVVLSAVGFDAELTKAIVYMGHSCGGLCGNGSYHYFEKKNGVWKETNWKGSSCTWVS